MVFSLNQFEGLRTEANTVLWFGDVKKVNFILMNMWADDTDDTKYWKIGSFLKATNSPKSSPNITLLSILK